MTKLEEENSMMKNTKVNQPASKSVFKKPTAPPLKKSTGKTSKKVPMKKTATEETESKDTVFKTPKAIVKKPAIKITTQKAVAVTESSKSPPKPTQEAVAVAASPKSPQKPTQKAVSATASPKSPQKPTQKAIAVTASTKTQQKPTQKAVAGTASTKTQQKPTPKAVAATASTKAPQKPVPKSVAESPLKVTQEEEEDVSKGNANSPVKKLVKALPKNTTSPKPAAAKSSQKVPATTTTPVSLDLDMKGLIEEKLANEKTKKQVKKAAIGKATQSTKESCSNLDSFSYTDMKGLEALPVLDEGEEDRGRKYNDPRLNLKIRVPGGSIKFCYDIDSDDKNALKYTCNACNVPINGTKNFEVHVNGRKHNKNAVIVNIGKPAPKFDDKPKVSEPVKVADDDDESDEGTYMYQKPENQKSRGNILAVLDGSGTCPPGEEDYMVLEDSQVLQGISDSNKDVAVVGIDLILEIVNSDEAVAPIYFCVLCKKNVTVRIVNTHLSSKKHRHKYLEMFFPTADSAFESFRDFEHLQCSFDVLSEVCEAIESKFGRYNAAKISKSSYIGNEGKVNEAVLASHLVGETEDFKFAGLLEELQRRKEIERKQAVSSMSTLSFFGETTITQRPEPKPMKFEEAPMKLEEAPVDPEKAPVKPERATVKAEEAPTKPEEAQMKREISDTCEERAGSSRWERDTIEKEPPRQADEPEDTKTSVGSSKGSKSYYKLAKERVGSAEENLSEEDVDAVKESVNDFGEAISSDEEGLLQEEEKYRKPKVENLRKQYPLQTVHDSHITSARPIEGYPRYEVSPYPPRGYPRFPRPRGMPSAARGRAMLMSHMNWLRHAMPVLYPEMNKFWQSQMEDEGKLVSRAVRDPPSKKARSRSYSRSPRRRHKRSYSGSRSKSPFEEHYESFRRYRKEMSRQSEKHASQWRLYSRQPEEHPLYKAEWSRFWAKRYREVLASGKDPSKHDYNVDWVGYWKDRANELRKEEFNAIRRRIQKENRLDRSPSTPNRKLFYERKKRRRSTSSKREKKQRIDDMMGYIRRSSKSPSRTSRKFTDSVIDTLRLLSAMEDQLASYGAKINPLLTRALRMEESMKYSSESLLAEDQVQEFFRVSKEKLATQLKARLVSSSKIDATETAVERIAALLKKAPKGSGSADVIIDGVNLSTIAKLTVGMNQNDIAKEIAKSLLSQGRENITSRQLQDLMKEVRVIQAERKPSSSASTAQLSVPPPGFAPIPVPSAFPSTSSAGPSGLGMLQSSRTSEKGMKPAEHAAYVKNIVAANNMRALNVDDLEFCMKNIRIFTPTQQNNLLMHMQMLEKTGDPRSTQLKQALLASDPRNPKTVGASTMTSGPMGERKKMEFMVDLATQQRQKIVAKSLRDKLASQQLFSQFMAKTPSERPGFGYSS